MDDSHDQNLLRLMDRKNKNNDNNHSIFSSSPESLNLSFNTGMENDENKQKIDYLSYQAETLEDQATELKDENNRLRVLLRTRENDIFKLKNNLDELKKATGGGGLGSEKAVQRIVELSKKNRELTSQIEVERSTIKRLNSKLDNLNNQEVQRKIKNAVKAKKQECESPRDDVEKQLKERVNTLTLKQTESSHQICSLQQENKLLLKLLQREVGEGATIQNVLANPNSWRGRSEQIAMLQTKLNTIKLDSGTETPSRLERKRQKDIKTMENNRKQQLQDLRAEKETVEQQLLQYKKNYDALKARNSTLSTDMKTMRAQLNALIDKGRTDDELINRLLEEKDAGKKDADIEEIWRKEDELQNLKQLVTDKDVRIQQLEEEITKTREKQMSSAEVLAPIARTTSADSRHRDGTDTSTEYILRAAEVERDRLFELAEILNTRSSESNEKLAKTEIQFKKLVRENAELERIVENLKSKKIPKCESCNTTAKLKDPHHLSSQLDILGDEISVLKAHISASQEERQQDLAKYKNMLSSAREIFLVGLKEVTAAAHQNKK